MKMKSIRLDFPANVTNGLSNSQILAILGAALAIAHKKANTEPVKSTFLELAQSTVRARVNEFDDLREKNGGVPCTGPVFYIP